MLNLEVLRPQDVELGHFYVRNTNGVGACNANLA